MASKKPLEPYTQVAVTGYYAGTLSMCSVLSAIAWGTSHGYFLNSLLFMKSYAGGWEDW